MKYLWIIILVALSACTTANKERLVVGFIRPSLNHLPHTYGLSKGLIDSTGYDYRYFNAGWELNEALCAGRVDAGIMPFTYVVYDADKGKDVKTLSFIERESDGIIAAHYINDFTQICRLGVLKNSTLDLFAQLLQEEYYPDSHPELISFRTPMDMAAALMAGEVDALSYYIPAILKFDENFHVLLWYGDFYPRHTCCNLVASGKAIRQKTSLLKKFRQELANSTHKLAKHPDSARILVAKKYKLSSEISNKAMNHTKFQFSLDKEGKEFEARVIRLMHARKYINTIPSPQQIYADF